MTRSTPNFSDELKRIYPDAYRGFLKAYPNPRCRKCDKPTGWQDRPVMISDEPEFVVMLLCPTAACDPDVATAEETAAAVQKLEDEYQKEKTREKSRAINLMTCRKADAFDRLQMAFKILPSSPVCIMHQLEGCWTCPMKNGEYIEN